MPGDHYRLCWSHDGGSLADFVVELDPEAVLRGPFVDNWNCTMGIQCEVRRHGRSWVPDWSQR